jgi:hypothetical protein
MAEACCIGVSQDHDGSGTEGKDQDNQEEGVVTDLECKRIR